MSPATCRSASVAELTPQRVTHHTAEVEMTTPCPRTPQDSAPTVTKSRLPDMELRIPAMFLPRGSAGGMEDLLTGIRDEVVVPPQKRKSLEESCTAVKEKVRKEIKCGSHFTVPEDIDGMKAGFNEGMTGR